MMELRDSSVSAVRDVWVQVVSGRKQRAEAEVQKAVSRLQHQAVVGSVQTGRAGLGRGKPPNRMVQAGTIERKDLVVAEVTRREQVPSVSLDKQKNIRSYNSILILI